MAPTNSPCRSSASSVLSGTSTATHRSAEAASANPRAFSDYADSIGVIAKPDRTIDCSRSVFTGCPAEPAKPGDDSEVHINLNEIALIRPRRTLPQDPVGAVPLVLFGRA